jgi:pSer/pThr/pTyr-binding forkhead associated (FHA) protein
VSADPDKWLEHSDLHDATATMPTPTTLPLITARVLLGRLSRSQNVTPDIDIRLLTLDPAISARHAELQLVDDAWEVRDLNSDNGTECNGIEVTSSTPVAMRSGDVLAIGAWSVVTLRSR